MIKKECRRCHKQIHPTTPALPRYYILCSQKCYDCWYGDKRPEKTYQKAVIAKENKEKITDSEPYEAQQWTDPQPNVV